METLEVLEYNKQGDQCQMISVDLGQRLADNEALIGEALRGLKSKLENDIYVHKTKFRERHLTALFPVSLPYMCEKIRVSVTYPRGKFDSATAVAAVATIAALFDGLHNELSERGKVPGTCPGLDVVWNELQ